MVTALATEAGVVQVAALADGGKLAATASQLTSDAADSQRRETSLSPIHSDYDTQ